MSATSSKLDRLAPTVTESAARCRAYACAEHACFQRPSASSSTHLALVDTLTYEVTERTVYRDISALMAQGVPIVGEAGGGYVLEAGFHMPPLMLTPAEIDAAILGAQWVQTRGEPEQPKALLPRSKP